MIKLSLYFFGIVLDTHAKQGIWEPDFILYQAHGWKETRSQWRILRMYKGRSTDMNKVVVNSLVGNQQIVEFMSTWRTRHHMHGSWRHKHEDTKKYYPHGWLCMFECNVYGEQDGPAVLVKHVPDFSYITNKNPDKGYQRLLERITHVKPPSEVLSRCNTAQYDEYSGRLYNHLQQYEQDRVKKYKENPDAWYFKDTMFDVNNQRYEIF